MPDENTNQPDGEKKEQLKGFMGGGFSFTTGDAPTGTNAGAGAGSAGAGAGAAGADANAHGQAGGGAPRAQMKLGWAADHPEYTPPPVRVAIIANYRGDADGEQTRAVPVTKANFGPDMTKLEASLLFDVPNHLAQAPKELVIKYAIGELRDLTPAGVCERVPELARVLSFYQDLTKLKAGQLTRSEFDANIGAVREFTALATAIDAATTAAVASTPSSAPPQPSAAPSAPAAPAKPAGGGDLIDDLLGMVDGGGGTASAPEPRPASAAVGSFISAIAGSGKKSDKPAASGVARALELTASVLSHQLDAIMHHPTFRAVERAWRGTKFIVEQLDFRASTPVSVELWHANDTQLVDVLRARVADPEVRGETEHALTLAITDFAPANTPADLETLSTLTDMAEEMQAPVLVSMGAAFLDQPSVGAINKLHNANTLTDGPTFAKYRSVREKESARWVGVGFNRFLLRAAWTPENTRGVPYTETIAARDDLAWGNPAWFIGALIARSATRMNWPTQYTGMRDGAVEGLPIVPQDLAVPDSAGIACDAPLSEEHVNDLARLGLMALTCRGNRDVAMLMRGPSLHLAKTFGNDPATNERSAQTSILAFQLLAARLGSVVMEAKPMLTRDPGEAAIQLAFEQFLSSILGDSGPGLRVQVQVMPDPTDPGMNMIGFTVKTGQAILGGTEVTLGVRAPNQ